MRHCLDHRGCTHGLVVVVVVVVEVVVVVVVVEVVVEVVVCSYYSISIKSRASKLTIVHHLSTH